MGRFCEVCHKGEMHGHNVSHANNKTCRTWAPNVQHVRVITENGTHTRMDVCTRCLRSGKVKRSV